MKKTEYLLDALFLLIYQLLSCMVIYFAAWMLVKIVDRFVYLPMFALYVVYATVLLVGVGVLMALYAYHGAYRAAAFDALGAVISGALATVVHLLIAAVFGYLPLLSGAPLYLSSLLVNGTGLTSAEQLANVPGYLPPVLFLLIMVLYHSIMLMLRRLAVNKRLIDRYELTGKAE
ncbi:MAG: hypothetical protein IJF33_05125 [Clostridia bacterium]|nr:hypothetical protein [Clostridia bacterium]